MPQDLGAVAWPVRTARLSIRPCTPDDLEATWAVRSSPGVGDWLTQAHDDRAEYEERFRDPDRMAKVLVVERDGDVVGDQMVVIEDAWAQAEVADRAAGVQAEIGWIIDPQHGGQGYATEAAAGLLRICFEDLGLRRVFAVSFAENVRSWRLMERLGMRREVYAVRGSLHRSRGWQDEVRYALLADEWQASQPDAKSG
jgi:RimJ/RimL family protein N-acetyltransferase